MEIRGTGGTEGRAPGTDGPAATYAFADCELDAVRCELRRGGAARHVEPQVFDVLLYLVTHRDRLVTRDELLDGVWGHRFVTPATLSSRIKAARQAIGDDGAAQRIIRTVRGRGFRFVAGVDVRAVEAPPAAPASTTPATSSDRPASPAARLVARSAQLGRLGEAFTKASAGARQFAFITGEAGIGKSTLAEAFVRSRPGRARVTRGQCAEQRDAGEPYLPILDALGRLGRGEDGAAVLDLLERYAPTWLVQLPALASEARLETAARRAFGATRERMLREMGEALEALASDVPLVLLLEDLHWSDPSTLDLLVWIGQRTDAARLLVVGTFRPADLDAGGRAAIAQLHRSGACTEIPLARWTESDVGDFCADCGPERPLTRDVVRLLHRRTDGNPLFVRTLLDAWTEAGVLFEQAAQGEIAQAEAGPPDALAGDVPESLRLLVEQRIGRLSDAEQRVLEAGSVAGPEFSAAVVAYALDLDESVVEEHCHGLAARGRVLRDGGVETWPDGRVSAVFSFTHHVFRDALYARIPAVRQVRLHRRIGEFLETLLATGTESAGRLAMHFRLGRDDARAIRYLRMSAERDLGRNAHREAIEHITLALELLRRQPETVETLRTELDLQRMLGPALLLTRGWGDAAAEDAYIRAREISERLDDSAQLAQVLQGMAYLHEIRGDFHRSQPLLERCLRIDRTDPGAYATVESHELLSCSLFHQGRFASALESARSAMHALLPDERGDAFAARLGMNAAVASHYWAGLALWCLGYPDQSLEPLRAARRIAESADLFYMQASAHGETAQLHHFRREIEPLARHADAALAIAERQGYPFHHAIALTLRGWADVMTGDATGLDRIRRGLDMQQAAGADMQRPYGLGLLAEAMLHLRRTSDGIDAVDEALDIIARRARSFFWEAELHRLRGELLLEHGDAGAAATRFRHALDIATRQDARSLQLRAAISLCRIQPARSRGAARTELRRVLRGFTEGFETPDLIDAAALLDA